jgi:hypothetical protein
VPLHIFLYYFCRSGKEFEKIIKMDAKLDTGGNSDRTQYGTYIYEIRGRLTTQHLAELVEGNAELGQTHT